MVCVGVAVKRTMYQRNVDVDMLNAVKSVLADVSSVSPSSEQGISLAISIIRVETKQDFFKTPFSCSLGQNCA